MMPAMLRTIVFVAMIASVSASETLNALVKASADFAAAIMQQLAAIQSEQSPTVFAEKTVSYAKAKTAYFNALRTAVPELMDSRDRQRTAATGTGQVRGGVLDRRRKAGKGGGRGNGSVAETTSV